MASRILANRYDLKEKIGEGGMSVVFRAHDMVLNRFVAVKILRPEYTKDNHFIDSFRRESQLAASIVDPNIVNVYDVGREGNIYFIVMELVEGMPLSEIIKTEGSLDPRRAANIARQIAMALSTAHKHNLIHRDVKPHNVLISRDDVAKIADFGIAKEVTKDTLVSESKEQEAVMGSIHYFSPEQARGNGVDERSDIYSLGIVLYEMVTGKVPFDGETAVEVAVKHISEEMTPPSSINPSIPKDVEDIILKATKKDPDERFNSAEELITALSFIKYTNLSNMAAKTAEPEDGDEGKEAGKTPAEIRAEHRNLKQQKWFGVIPKPSFLTKEKSEADADTTKKKKITLDKVIAVVLAILIAIPVSGGLYKAFFDPANKIKEFNLQDFRGMTFDEATEAAAEHNITIEKEKELNSDDVPEGQIINQSPSPNTVVKENTVVRVTISKGLQDGKIPNVVGKSQTTNRPNAKNLLENYGYEMGKITYNYSNDMPSGYVISQSPEKDTVAPAGTKVDLVISKGAKTDGGSTGGNTSDSGNTSGSETGGGTTTSDKVVVTFDGDNAKISIKNGTSGKTIGDSLAKAGLVPSGSDFVAKATELGLAEKLRSGDYTIEKSATLEEIIKIIAHQK